MGGLIRAYADLSDFVLTGTALRETGVDLWLYQSVFAAIAMSSWSPSSCW
jgi:hypothetical protein